MPGEFMDAPVVVVVSAKVSPLCSSVVTLRVLAVHTAYSVVFEEIAKVLAAA
ncbi:MAG: hypothetical protein ACO3Z0_01530 [Ilumatobacteraceae bacterium]